MSAALDAIRIAEGIIELREERQALLAENAQLKKEIEQLKLKRVHDIYTHIMRNNHLPERATA